VAGGDAQTAYIFITTGQSLSVGCASGGPVQTPATPGPIVGHFQNDNIWNDAHTGVRSPASDWTLVEPKNPMRTEGANDQYWPFNVWYESPCAAMAERFDELGLAPTGHINVGHNGQPYSVIKKGGSGPSYAGSMSELAEMNTKLVALGYTVIVAGIILIHGESDLGNASYGPTYLPELQSDYDTDCKAITGQTEDVPLYVSMPSAAWPTSASSYNDIHEQELTAHNGTTIVCVGPKAPDTSGYYIASDIHLSPAGTRAMGRQIATAIMEHRAGGYDPLQPLTCVKTGASTVDVTFQGTDSGALQLDSTYWDSNHSTALTEWQNGKGFELSDNTGRLTITGVSIAGNVVTVTTSATIGTSPVVSYAHLADGDSKPRRGQLRTTTGYWCAHFTRSVT